MSQLLTENLEHESVEAMGLSRHQFVSQPLTGPHSPNTNVIPCHGQAEQAFLFCVCRSLERVVGAELAAGEVHI